MDTPSPRRALFFLAYIWTEFQTGNRPGKVGFLGRIEDPIRNIRDEPIISFALTNVRQAYGLDLPYLRGSDGDGFPDVIDPAPFKAGFRNGVT